MICLTVWQELISTNYEIYKTWKFRNYCISYLYGDIGFRGYMNKKNIAIITGASSGFGKEFVKLLVKNNDLDEIT